MSNKQLDMSLLDKSLDDIDDLPGFAVPSNGEYLLSISMAVKEVNDKAAVEASFEVIECLKKDNDADPDSKKGDKFSTLFFLEGEEASVKISLGKLKEMLMDVAEATGQSNLLVLVRDTLANAIVQATVKRRTDREDKEKFYATVKNMKLV